MALDGLSSYLNIAKEKRKGHLRFLAFSGILLTSLSVNVGLDIWVVFDSIFKAGPDGRSYIEAFRKDAETNHLSRRLILVVGATGDFTVAVGDILLVSFYTFTWSKQLSER
jgi:hypothetical protein